MKYKKINSKNNKNIFLISFKWGFGFAPFPNSNPNYDKINNFIKI